MLRTNLSTRPFYNERAVHVAIGVAAAIVLALTALNIVRIVTLSRHNTELAARVGKERIETDNLNHQAVEIRRTINKEELAGVVAAAQEANALIDQRTFSWTEFFNRIESTLPPDVMLTSVRPSFKEDQTNVTMIVLGRRPEDIDEFMEKLDATGAFDQVLPTQQDRTEQGLFRVVVDSTYQAVVEEETPTTPAAPAPAAPPAPAPQAAPSTGGRGSSGGAPTSADSPPKTEPPTKAGTPGKAETPTRGGTPPKAGTPSKEGQRGGRQ